MPGILRGSSMIITQIFRSGDEERCGEEFFAIVPKDPDLIESLKEALEVVYNNLESFKYFTLRLDTEKRSVDVLEVV